MNWFSRCQTPSCFHREDTWNNSSFDIKISPSSLTHTGMQAERCLRSLSQQIYPRMRYWNYRREYCTQQFLHVISSNNQDWVPISWVVFFFKGKESCRFWGKWKLGTLLMLQLVPLNMRILLLAVFSGSESFHFLKCNAHARPHKSKYIRHNVEAQR